MSKQSRASQQRQGAGPSANDGRPPSTEALIAQIHDIADRLLRDDATRGDVKILARALKELRYAFKVFSTYRGRRKVTVFGSARLGPEHPVYQQAVAFGRAMAQAGWMVITGGASGIMEAGHLGAGREHSMGVNILLPFEQDANPIIAGDPKLVYLKYFFTRKLLFVKEADAAVVFPGGFGTMDEGFEVLTLVQTGKREMIPVVFVDEPGGDYWRSWQEHIRRFLLERGYMSESDLNLFKVTDRVEEALQEILDFYRVYHSMRYVNDVLVLRLKKRLSKELLRTINRQFRDILARGRFVQRGPYPQERDDQELLDYPRLAFHFCRHSFGRLRQLINTINAGA